MPTLCLTTPGTRISLRSERLRIEVPECEENPQASIRDLPLADIERLVLSETCSLSTPALADLLRREIPVVLTAAGEHVLGLCLPPAPHSTARLAQYRAASDTGFALTVAASLVRSKIANSRRVLQRLATNREDASVESCLKTLALLAAKCGDAPNLDVLRGFEGTSAGQYFDAYARFFPESAPFERRSRRPPHNAANAILSYTYTLLAAETEAEIHAAGLDPALGFLHDSTDRRASLALDLIEPFRAPVADAMALDLLSHGTLQPAKHFEPRNGGIYLNLSGKKRFFVALERRMEREFTSDQHGRRTSLRREIQAQIRNLKSALLGESAFLPFIMN